MTESIPTREQLAQWLEDGCGHGVLALDDTIDLFVACVMDWVTTQDSNQGHPVTRQQLWDMAFALRARVEHEELP